MTMQMGRERIGWSVPRLCNSCYPAVGGTYYNMPLGGGGG